MGRGFIFQCGGDADPELPETVGAKATTSSSFLASPAGKLLMQQHWLWQWRKSKWVLDTRSLSIAPLSPYFTPPSLASGLMGHGLGRSCCSSVTPAAPSRRKKSQQHTLNLIHIYKSQGNELTHGTHNIVVCKDLLKISPPFFCAASLHTERTNKWKIKAKISSLSPGHLSWRQNQCIKH